MSKIEQLLVYFLGPLAVVAGLLACLFALNWLLARLQKAKPERRLHRQVIMLVATLLALFLLIILLPLSDTLRGQILSLLGILLSATIALSSTTFLGNALAGVLLRTVRSFRIGDFIYIQEQFGRVSGRGLFHIEIQTEDRDLVTLPNLYLTNNPVKVTRASGTVVSAEISLGYDVPHSTVESLLAQAATAAGLEDPFVYLLQLGDFSVRYRVNGVLTDVKQLLSARSRLNGAALDTLHQAGIEIVSPTFMNTRNVTDRTFIARPGKTEEESLEGMEPEDIIFDKAEKAATLEEQKAYLAKIQKRIEVVNSALTKTAEEKRPKVAQKLELLRRQQKQLADRVAQETARIENEKEEE